MPLFFSTGYCVSLMPLICVLTLIRVIITFNQIFVTKVLVPLMCEKSITVITLSSI